MMSINIPEHAGVILLKNAVTFPHGVLEESDPVKRAETLIRHLRIQKTPK